MVVRQPPAATAAAAAPLRLVVAGPRLPGSPLSVVVQADDFVVLDLFFCFLFVRFTIYDLRAAAAAAAASNRAASSEQPSVGVGNRSGESLRCSSPKREENIHGAVNSYGLLCFKALDPTIPPNGSILSIPVAKQDPKNK